VAGPLEILDLNSTSFWFFFPTKVTAQVCGATELYIPWDGLSRKHFSTD
jgi:hypothetical protein